MSSALYRMVSTLCLLSPLEGRAWERALNLILRTYFELVNLASLEVVRLVSQVKLVRLALLAIHDKKHICVGTSSSDVTRVHRHLVRDFYPNKNNNILVSIFFYMNVPQTTFKALLGKMKEQKRKLLGLL